jgi:CTP:molybdopterin cytidylyltransferase MocA
VAAGLDRTWVVTGSADLTSLVPASVELLVNPDWEAGQATSLQVAVVAARRAGVDAIVVGLADQPLVTPESWRAVAESDAAIAVATYDGQRRNPVKLSSTVWDLLPGSGDQGARVVMRTRPDLVREVPCRGDPMDIDTREDLEIWS